MKFSSLVVAAMLLAGCASQRRPGLSDTSKGQINKNRDRDLSECEREAAFAGAGEKGQVFNNCMKARGY